METPHFPNDENGVILRRMYDSGDDLTKPRTIDFCFIFPERQQAIAFAQTIDDRDIEVCISHYPEQERWEVIVKRHMMPTHQAITALESALTLKAESAHGEADGWGCMMVEGQ